MLVLVLFYSALLDCPVVWNYVILHVNFVNEHVDKITGI